MNEEKETCSACGSADGPYFHCMLVIQKECRKRDIITMLTMLTFFLIQFLHAGK